MSTRALDVITILHALNRLGEEINSTGWNAINSRQEKVFSWLDDHREKLSKLTGIDAKASQFCDTLNDFLEKTASTQTDNTTRITRGTPCPDL